MRVAHLSDLHFGKAVSPERLQSLGRDLLALAPDLLVITGDLTDQGRISQFRSARQFLIELAIPFIAVPGNREISATALWELIPRLAMGRYRRFFGASDRVVYRSDEHRTVFFGLNSVHWFPSWPGIIGRERRYWLKEQAERFPDYRKVVFLHHPAVPVIRASSFWAHALSDAGDLLTVCTQAGISLILQGHKHRSAVVELRFPEHKSKVVVVSAGAPLVPRWDCSYHLLTFNSTSIIVTPREFRTDQFAETGGYEFSLRWDGDRGSPDAR